MQIDKLLSPILHTIRTRKINSFIQYQKLSLSINLQRQRQRQRQGSTNNQNDLQGIQNGSLQTGEIDAENKQVGEPDQGKLDWIFQGERKCVKSFTANSGRGDNYNTISNCYPKQKEQIFALQQCLPHKKMPQPSFLQKKSILMRSPRTVQVQKFNLRPSQTYSVPSPSLSSRKGKGRVATTDFAPQNAFASADKNENENGERQIKVNGYDQRTAQAKRIVKQTCKIKSKIKDKKHLIQDINLEDLELKLYRKREWMTRYEHFMQDLQKREKTKQQKNTDIPKQQKMQNFQNKSSSNPKIKNFQNLQSNPQSPNYLSFSSPCSSQKPKQPKLLYNTLIQKQHNTINIHDILRQSLSLTIPCPATLFTENGHLSGNVFPVSKKKFWNFGTKNGRKCALTPRSKGEQDGDSNCNNQDQIQAVLVSLQNYSSINSNNQSIINNSIEPTKPKRTKKIKSIRYGRSLKKMQL